MRTGTASIVHTDTRIPIPTAAIRIAAKDIAIAIVATTGVTIMDPATIVARKCHDG